MSLIKSYEDYGPEGKLTHSEKVTIERLDEKGESNIFLCLPLISIFFGSIVSGFGLGLSGFGFILL